MDRNCTPYQVGQTFGIEKLARKLTNIKENDIYYITPNNKTEKMCFVSTFTVWVNKQNKLTTIKKDFVNHEIRNILGYYDNARTAKTPEALKGELRVSGKQVSLSYLVQTLSEMSPEDARHEAQFSREEFKRAIVDICRILKLL